MSEVTYRVGQELQITFVARVAEVGALHDQQEGRIVRLETNANPTGWINPDDEALTIEVLTPPLPIDPGMYWQADAVGRQGTLGEQHTDGKEFHYLNGQGVWVDLGFGTPDADEPIYPLVENPF